MKNSAKHFKNKILVALSVVTFAVTALAANANADHRNRDFDYAKVSSVEPIYRTVSHRIPVEQCRLETVRVDDRHHHSKTPAIVGGLIGAKIGSKLGHKHHEKRVGTIAGAILGASIGADIGANNRRHNHSPVYREVERCDTRYTTEYEKRIVGYDVTYRYHGRTYRTRTDQHPGSRIRVAVSVAPIH